MWWLLSLFCRALTHTLNTPTSSEPGNYLDERGSAMTDLTLVTDATYLDVLEAEIRRRMAVVAKLNVRGFDGRKVKDAGIADLDKLFDMYADARAEA